MLAITNVIYWAASTNQVLQATTDLNGSWTNVPGTQEQHQSEMVTTNASGFCLVVQQ